MIKKIQVHQYRRLKDISFELSQNVTAISGINGSCKTSLLHIISNSFRAMTKTNSLLENVEIVPIINNINHSVNPKIETLTKGDHEYNDPAPNLKGNLYTVTYENDLELSFRRHNSRKNNGTRFSVKPRYNKPGESLPVCPVVYLSMGRLFNFGEFSEEEKIQKIKVSLPEEYQRNINKNYKKLTGLDVFGIVPYKMGKIKNRSSFNTSTQGVDSNTISSGEDNIYIILTALESLRYYFDNIDSSNSIESMLLIDEFDATLHPGIQNDLYDLIYQYSCNYKIQVVFTTHSFSLIEHIIRNKKNIIYLINQETRIEKLEDNNIHTINRLLNNQTKNNVLDVKKIPVFLEDEEARTFLDLILEYYVTEKRLQSIINIRPYLYKVNIKMSSDNLRSMFMDKFLINSTLKSICILDGDQHSLRKLGNHIITLPGTKSPEVEICEYLKKLIDENSDLLNNPDFFELGYTVPMLKSEILSKIDEFNESIKKLKTEGESSKGKSREFYKNLYNDNIPLFTLLTNLWIKNNEKEVKDFYDDLKIMFLKCAEFHMIDKRLWIDEEYEEGELN
ncbi:AAA family ATPase [Staphylococcus epidermidis]|nr:AAA family ATPase [Staphylococcus epidermidis]MCG2333615.1 AAA family ATPase [Staphylococcus epidermidis]MCG2355806.1 AAA family ATPase [Staphylococcus epidermidis]MCG2360346.1 AAA family ATPase [Staphylococcus epidermidis]MCG2367327.1 AAA family ATPase [Staphylococcus epidermidis]